MWIQTTINKKDEFALRALDIAVKYPNAVKLIAKTAKPPEGWAQYDFDEKTDVWVDVSHPEVMKLYQNVLHEKKEEVMTKELTTNERKQVYGLLNQNLNALKSVLPESMKPEKVMRLGYQIVVKNPKLARECSGASLINAVLEGASLGLDIGGPLGLAHILPYKGEAQLRVDYKGEIELMYRSPLVKKVVANAVYENDFFEYEYGSEQFLRHRPAPAGLKGKLIYAYCHVFFSNDDSNFVVCDKDMADAAKASSPAKDSNKSPWNHPARVHHMWIKTAVHRISKVIPMSPDLQRAVSLQSRGEEKPAEQAYDHTIDAEFSELHRQTTPVNQQPPPPAQKPPADAEPETQEERETTQEESTLISNYDYARTKMGEEFAEACAALKINPEVKHTMEQIKKIVGKLAEAV